MTMVLPLLLLVVTVAAASATAPPRATDIREVMANCPPLPSRPPPTSVYDLRPVDVSVVAAIGDSITAAFAASGSIWEYRDESWSIGGGANKVTLPNYMRVYAPNITGMSMEDHLPEVHGSPHSYPSDHLNAAQSEAKVGDIDTQQVTYLVDQLAKMGVADEDWKVLTLWIGANDICESCRNRSSESPDAFEAKYDTALAHIHKSVPRVFVNMIPTMNLSYLAKIDRKRLGCDLEHLLFSECYCVFKGHSPDWAIMDDMTVAYNQRIHKLAAKYNAMDDQSAFVVQPFLERTAIPDASYLSTLDCFHPALKTHRDLATALWNQMQTPIADKVDVIDDFNQPPICPNATTLYYAK